jgi:predicted amidohydrolase
MARHETGRGDGEGEGMTLPPLRVALAQIHCPWADTRGNLERMAGWSDRAKADGAKLVAFPVVAETRDGGEQLVFASVGEAAPQGDDR